MPVKKHTKLPPLILLLSAFLCPHAFAEKSCLDSKITIPLTSLAQDSVASQLGWVADPIATNRCHGYYLEGAFPSAVSVGKNNLLKISSDQTLFAQHGTSTLEGNISVTQNGQEVTGNKAFLYRDPVTGKISAIDILGHVHLREPNTLVVAQTAHMDLVKKNAISAKHRLPYRGIQ